MYITHYSITSDNRMKRRSLPWNFWMWQAEWKWGEEKKKNLRQKEKDGPERSSSAQLTWVIIDVSTRRDIQISSHRQLWYCSRHYSFVVPHVRHGTTSLITSLPPLTHTRARTNVRFSFLPVCCWNDYWRLGLYLKCVGTEKKMRCRWWRWQLRQFEHKHFFRKRTQDRATSGASVPYMMYSPFIWRFFINRR